MEGKKPTLFGRNRGQFKFIFLDFRGGRGILRPVTTDFLLSLSRTDERPERTWRLRPVAISRREISKGETGMPTGTVKWFNATKGYGFIAPDDGGKDVFVHISAVERAGFKGLNDNQKIGYELQSGRDGRSSASDLQLL